MMRPWDRKRVGDAAIIARGAERRDDPPSRYTFSLGDKMGNTGEEDKRESAPEDATEEVEWAPGQIVRKVGG